MLQGAWKMCDCIKKAQYRIKYCNAVNMAMTHQLLRRILKYLQPRRRTTDQLLNVSKVTPASSMTRENKMCKIIARSQESKFWVLQLNIYNPNHYDTTHVWKSELCASIVNCIKARPEIFLFHSSSSSSSTTMKLIVTFFVVAILIFKVISFILLIIFFA